MESLSLRPIGVVRSPFPDPRGAPIQPRSARGIAGTVELLPEFQEGIEDLDGFSHIILIYYFHLSIGYSLKVKPFLDNEPRGVFSTRAPRRPNQIGVSVVRLDRIDGGTLHVSNLDIVDGTPLLDIKPYVPHFDEEEDVRIGWLTGKIGVGFDKKADGRFLEERKQARDKTCEQE